MNLETYDIVSEIRIYAGKVLSCVYMDYLSWAAQLCCTTSIETFLLQLHRVTALPWLFSMPEGIIFMKIFPNSLNLALPYSS